MQGLLGKQTAKTPRIIDSPAISYPDEWGNEPMDLELVHEEPHRKDLLWEAIMRVCEIDTEHITSSARGSYNKAASQLRQVSATPEDVAARADRYRTRFPFSALTPPALARHWCELQPPAVRPSVPSVVVREEEVWMPGVGWCSR